MIFFLYGENTFLSKQKQNELKNKFLREVDQSGDSLHFLDGENLNLNKFNEAVAPASLFTRKRMIIINNLFTNKDEEIFSLLLNYLQNKFNADNIIIFRDSINAKSINKEKEKKALFNFLTKKNQKIKIFSQEFKNLNIFLFANWIKNEFTKRNKIISAPNANLMASLIGNDMWQAYNEIEKLSNYSQEKEIKTKDINFFIKGKFDDNIFALTDAIAAQKKALAMKLLQEQNDFGLGDTYLCAMILRQFRLLLITKSALEKNLNATQISQKFKLHPFVAKKSSQQCLNFSFEKLKRLFSQIIEIDKKIKTGQSNFQSEISILLNKEI